MADGKYSRLMVRQLPFVNRKDTRCVWPYEKTKKGYDHTTHAVNGDQKAPTHAYKQRGQAPAQTIFTLSGLPITHIY